MIDLDELRVQGEALRETIANDLPVDTDVVETWIADMLDHMGTGSTRIADSLDCVVLLATWARVMEAAHPDIAVMGWRAPAGYMLNATAPEGTEFVLDDFGITHPTGAKTLAVQKGRKVGQLIFYNDSRPQAWLRTLFENRAFELLAGAYYEHADLPMPAGGMPDGTTRRGLREVKS